MDGVLYCGVNYTVQCNGTKGQMMTVSIGRLKDTNGRLPEGVREWSRTRFDHLLPSIRSLAAQIGHFA